MANKPTYQYRSYSMASEALDPNDAFSKPVVRQRFQRTAAAAAVVEAPIDDTALPSVLEIVVSAENSPGQVFSPPVSIPESNSDVADSNLSSSDNEDSSPPLTSSQSSTSSINKRLRESSIKQREESLTPVDKKSRVFEFDDDDEMAADMTAKRAKTEEAVGAKFLPKKANRAVYTHKWNTDDVEEEILKEDRAEINSVVAQPPKRTFQPVLTALPRKPVYMRESSSSGRVRNVKEAHEMFESGEHDDFKQELAYSLSDFKDSSMKVKALSAISLARKCVANNFRHFIRSENMVMSVFRAFSDAPESPIFSLGASAVIYLLSRDFISMKIEVSGLRLFSQLLRIDTLEFEPEKEQFLTMVWEVFTNYLEKTDIEGQKVTFELKKEDVTPSALILESLVFIVARNANDELLKSELLNLGVLQWIVAKIENTVNSLSNSSEKSEDEIVRDLIISDRCFRILENCSMLHKKNQAFLISHRGNVLINSCSKFLNLIHERLANSEVGALSARYMICLSVMVRTLINLSHENEVCCSKLGQISGFLPSCLTAFTYLAPKYSPQDKVFDIYVLLLSLLVNLTERCNANRKTLLGITTKVFNIEKKTTEEQDSLEALATLFGFHESKAKIIDDDIDNDLAFEEVGDDESDKGSDSDEDEEGTRKDGRLDRDKIQDMGQEDMINAVQAVMNKAHAHMEDSVVASYLALLIGCLLQQNEELMEKVKKCLPDGKVEPMVSQLQRFLDFMRITISSKNGGDNSGCRSIERIIDLLERIA